MAPSLRSIKNETERNETILRRLQSRTKGLGFWAAVDAVKRLGLGGIFAKEVAEIEEEKRQS